MRLALFVFLVLVCNFSPSDIRTVAHMGHGQVKHSPLIVISFDGFRYDYIYRTGANLTSFERFKENGVYARKGLHNVFPTSTIANHWTLATGLYPESHGMINNDIHDDNILKPFHPKWRDKDYKNDPRYYDAGAEPIWVTNEKQSKAGRSGTIMWYGAENPVKHYRPSLHMDFDKEVSSETRIDTAVEWLTFHENPINLCMIYFGEPDDIGHHYGPESVNVTDMISEINRVLDYLMKKLEKHDILDDVNIIITSDHGMVDVSSTKCIDLDEIVPAYMYKSFGVSPLALIYPIEGKSK